MSWKYRGRSPIFFQCTEDSDIKTDLAQRIAMDIPQFSDITENNRKYKFVMKIQESEILKSLGFCINFFLKIAKIAITNNNHRNMTSVSISSSFSLLTTSTVWNSRCIRNLLVFCAVVNLGYARVNKLPNISQFRWTNMNKSGKNLIFKTF